MSTSAIAGRDRVERPEADRRRLGPGPSGAIRHRNSRSRRRAGVGVGRHRSLRGPPFDYSGDGSASWHWNLAHAVLAVAPGIAGVLLGLFVIAESRGVVVGRGRLSLATAGMLLMVCGAWFAVGPLAWPVISNGCRYFVATTHLRVLAYEVGYSIGTGLILVVCGAFVDGWASRHQPRVSPWRCRLTRCLARSSRESESEDEPPGLPAMRGSSGHLALDHRAGRDGSEGGGRASTGRSSHGVHGDEDLAAVLGPSEKARASPNRSSGKRWVMSAEGRGGRAGRWHRRSEPGTPSTRGW